MRIVVYLEGGLVQDVEADAPGIEFVVADLDVDMAADDDSLAELPGPDGDAGPGTEAYLGRAGIAAYCPGMVSTVFEKAREVYERLDNAT